ncbi:MAG: LysM peptidoglycan-binding domain-containing protein [Fibrobacterales bacterium]
MSLRRTVYITALITPLLFAYVVKEGDTLWDLSDSVLNDPFKWGIIWENNPHIENPHVIYPGDEITLDGEPVPEELELESIADAPIEDYTEETPEPDTLPKGIQFNGRGIKERLHENFINRLGPLGENYIEEEDALNILKSEIPDTLAYRPQPRILKQALQRQAPFLEKPYSDYRTYSTEFRISPELQSSGLLLKNNEEFVLHAGSIDGLTRGDTIELFTHNADRYPILFSKTHSVFFTAVKPIGLAIVKSISDTNSRAQIVSAFGPISPIHSRARVYTPQTLRYVNFYQPVESIDTQKMASVVHIFDESNYVKFHNWIAINRGTKDGFHPGDAIHILEHKNKAGLSPRIVASGIIIQARQVTASILIHQVHYPQRNIKLLDNVAVVQKAME